MRMVPPLSRASKMYVLRPVGLARTASVGVYLSHKNAWDLSEGQVKSLILVSVKRFRTGFSSMGPFGICRQSVGKFTE